MRIFGVWKRILSLTVLFLSTAASASFLDLPGSFIDPCLNPGITSKSYIKPNETMPHRARPILEKAPAGVYVGVGTERGIMSVIQAPQITHMVLVDHMVHICAFNNINFALIKLSQGNRLLYKHLRQKALFEEWMKIAEQVPLTARERNFSTSKPLYIFWKAATQQFTRGGIDFERGIVKNHFIGGVHYIEDDEAFAKIYQMVVNNRVESIYFELGFEPELEALGKAMNKANLPLAILDISNAWYEQYLDVSGVRTLVQNVKKHFILDPKSFVMATGDNFRLANPLEPIVGERDGGAIFSRYTAFTFDFLMQNPTPFPFSSRAYDGEIDKKLGDIWGYDEPTQGACDKALLLWPRKKK